MAKYIPLTRNEPADVSREISRRVETRRETCRCGCHGQDPWHRLQYTRKLRCVTAHTEPVVLREPRTVELSEGASAVITGILEVGTAEVKLPWGTEPVRCIVRFGDGVVASFGDWELSKLRP